MLLREDQQVLLVAIAEDSEKRYTVLTEPLTWESSDPSLIVQAADEWGTSAWVTPIGKPGDGAIIRVSGDGVIGGYAIEITPGAATRAANATINPGPVAGFQIYPVQFAMKVVSEG
jgi:hypothetical protein